MTPNPRKSAARQQPVRASPPAQRQLTCFVVTGFGNKTDYSTGRVLNLDKTYEQLVQPACDRVNVNCFRAIDANLTGSIDQVMYHWIYHADLVIADLSTLNANVFYELGVRHALRPNTTLVIAESVLIQRIPFDLSSFVVHKYEHGGESINAAEQQRFVAHLAAVLDKIVATENRRQQDAPGTGRETDSPVFKFLHGMTPSAYAAGSYIEPPAYTAPALRQKQEVQAGESLASLIAKAESAKKRADFAEAIGLFNRAIDKQTEGKPDGKPDVYLAQRLALVTYKGGEQKGSDGQIDKAVAVAALMAAERLLAKYCEPKITNDPETLGLSGAINKRLFEVTGDAQYLDRAIRFYERGFYVKQDYYNGINVAYMYTQRANLLPDRFDAIVSYGHANMIRRHVVEICRDLIDDEKGFASRGDPEWVYLSLAEAFHGLGRTADEDRLGPTIDNLASEFGKRSRLEQRAKLQRAIDEFNLRIRPDELHASPAAATAGPKPATSTPAAPTVPAPAASQAPLAQRAVAALNPATDPTGRRTISVDADIEPGKAVKSIKVVCKIEYL